MKDNEIIDLYWNRCESAISATSDKYGRYCLYISLGILGNSQDAEECVSDAYLAAWNSIPPQRPECLPAYLGKIVRNFSFTKRKHQTAQKRFSGEHDLVLSELEDCLPSASSIEQALEEKTLIACIEDFLRSQSFEKRNIFIRRYWYLSPICEIASELGISESKTVSLLFRMRNKLKQHLEKEGITL